MRPQWRVAAVLVPGLVLGFAIPSAQAQRDDVVKRGEYLARAGDCIACHTAPEGHIFAGGRAMPTPFGTLSSAFIWL